MQEEAEMIRRLILTDGSHEPVREYSVIGNDKGNDKGNRVRYFSTERHAWEELPEAMIDWNATKNYAVQAQNKVSEQSREAWQQAESARTEYEARLPEISPGLRIPASGGVFMLDVYKEKPGQEKSGQNGSGQEESGLVPLRQSGADRNRNMKSNILRGLINPVAGSKHTIELEGLHASVQAHTGTPEIFIHIDPYDEIVGYTSSTAHEHLQLVRCTRKKDKREVVALNIAIYGKVSRQTEGVAIRVEPISEYWVRIVPTEPLPPGEYALVEWDARGAVNEFVWDFGVNPDAPPNAVVTHGARTNPDDVPMLIQNVDEDDEDGRITRMAE